MVKNQFDKLKKTLVNLTDSTKGAGKRDGTKNYQNSNPIYEDSDNIFGSMYDAAFGIFKKNKTKPKHNSTKSSSQPVTYTNFEKAWPLDFEIYKKPKELASSIIFAPNWLKLTLGLSVIFVITSLSFTIWGSFLLISTEKPTEGGRFSEAFLGSTATQFNPVLNVKNEFERRVIDLTYLPLYRVIGGSKDARPKILPIILEKEPEWINTEGKPNYTKLSFTIRNDLKWSDKSPIVMDDILYTFELLKKPNNNTNANFSKVFKDVDIVKNGNYRFDLISPTPKPNLIYEAGFYPIPKDVFGGQSNIENLNTNLNSLRLKVTSGYYSMPPSFTSGKEIVNNPVVNSSGEVVEVLLKKNMNLNGKDILNGIDIAKNIRVENGQINFEKEQLKNIFLNEYYIKNYEVFDDSGGDVESIEKDFKDGKIDFYTRSLDANSTNKSSEEIKKKLGSRQKILPTPIYYSLFFNTGITKGNYTGYLINESLRKYVACSLRNGFEISATAKGYFEPISSPKTYPLQLSQGNQPSIENSTICPQIQSEVEKILLDATTEGGGKIYSFREENGVKKVYIFESPANFKIVSTLESNDLLASELTDKLKEMGIEVSWQTEPAFSSEIVDPKNKTYHLALLPIKIQYNNIYSVFGVGGSNLIQISENNRKPIPDYNFEENLKKMLNSNYSDMEAQKNVDKVFNDHSVLVNLAGGKQEINYSSRLNGYDEFNLPSVSSTNEIIQSMPHWYVSTSRTIR